MHYMWDLIKSNQKLRKNRELIIEIYNTLFQKVDDNYYDIGYFAIELANRKRIRFLANNFIKRYSKTWREGYPFYYKCISANPHFIIFDHCLNSIEFGHHDIQDLGKNNKQNYELYQEFARRENKNQSKNSEENNDFFGQEEVDSDEETRAQRIKNWKKTPLEELQIKVRKYLEMDLSEYEQEI